MINTKNPALVLGMFETGLGVSRSLSRAGIMVFGLDFKKDIAFYSRCVDARLCPHPTSQRKGFLEYLIDFGRRCKEKPALFVTSDDFVVAVSESQDILKEHFLFNIPFVGLLKKITNKYSQYELALNAQVDVPKTQIIDEPGAVSQVQQMLDFPVFAKGLDVSAWRKKVSRTIKGFEIRDAKELEEKLAPIVKEGVSVLIQEIIPGPDTNHFKYNVYISKTGEILLGFTLRKIRQNPIHFGVGAVVESIHYPELVAEGEKLFNAIGYRGVGSAEFKLDARDGKLKLIEINPRYWQQNFLPTACGMNFPLMDYLEATGQNPTRIDAFTPGIKWVNRYMDLDSFLAYRREGTLTFRAWRRSLKGKKVYSDFSWDDMKPILWEFKSPKRLLKIPSYIIREV